MAEKNKKGFCADNPFVGKPSMPKGHLRDAMKALTVDNPDYDITQSEVANKLGVTQSLISRIKRGKDVKVLTDWHIWKLLKLLKTYNKSVLAQKRFKDWMRRHPEAEAKRQYDRLMAEHKAQQAEPKGTSKPITSVKLVIPKAKRKKAKVAAKKAPAPPTDDLSDLRDITLPTESNHSPDAIRVAGERMLAKANFFDTYEQLGDHHRVVMIHRLLAHVETSAIVEITDEEIE